MIEWNLFLCDEALFDAGYAPDDEDEIYDEVEDKKKLMHIFRKVFSFQLLTAYENLKLDKERYGLTQSTYRLYIMRYLESIFKKSSSLSHNIFIDDLEDGFGNGPDIKEVILRLINKHEICHPLVLCDEAALPQVFFGEKGVKAYPYSLLLEENLSNPIRRNTSGFEFQALPNQPFYLYQEWFTELFKDEKEIVIFDPYLLNENGRHTWNSVYIWHIEEGSVLHIYTSIDNLVSDRKRTVSVETVVKDFLDKAKQHKLTIYWHDCKNYDEVHDRFIFLKKYKVTLGRGLDFVYNANKTKNILKDCNIHIDKRKKDESDIQALKKKGNYQPYYPATN